MKTSDKSPSDIIQYIGEIIREREQKSLPTFYTISIEQYEKSTPVAEKEEGYDNFKQQILKYMSDYNLTAITIQLFSGKSRRVTTPFQTFKVPIKKHNPAIFLGNPEKEQSNNIEQIENSIPVGRYYDEKFELQMRIMRIELEKQSLNERLIQLTERYEEKLKDQDARTDEKIKSLQEEIEEKDDQIREFEKEIAKSEKEKHNSFGNITLAGIGTRIVEGLANTETGKGVLKGLLGPAGYETLQGHLAGIENEKKNIEAEKPTARIISEEETNKNDPRQVALNYILKVGKNLPDVHLRMLYDLAELTEKNTKDLEVVWKIAQQIKQQRGGHGQSPVFKAEEKQQEKKKEEEKEKDEEKEQTDSDEDQTMKIV